MATTAMFGAEKLTDQVVAAAANGSAPDAARIAEAFAPRVRLMVTARLSPTPAQLHAVEDVSQQVMLALVAGIGSMHTQTLQGLRAFASTLVSRMVADFLKGRGAGEKPLRLAASLDSTIVTASRAMPMWEILAAGDPSPSSVAARGERMVQVMEELGQLKPQYRNVITLAFFDQLPTREIAKRMDLSRPAAAMLLIRAIKTLRRNLTGISEA